MGLVRNAVYSEDCPHCGAVNHFDAGDPADITGVDVEALKCHRCKNVFLTEGGDWTTPEDANTVDGRVKP
jgi:phage FluMu protein Com